MLKRDVEKLLEKYGYEHEFIENHKGKGVMIKRHEEVGEIFYYENIKEPSEFERLLQEGLRCLEEEKSFFEEYEQDWIVYEKIKDKLVLSIRPGFRKIDKEIIHRKVLDLLIIPVIAYEQFSIVSRYSMLKEWGVSEDEIFEQAKRNQKHNKFVLKNIMDIIFSTIGIEVDSNGEDNEVFVAYNMTSGSNTLGANILLEPDKLKYIEERIGEYYIIPSSIHEIICVKKEDNIIEGLKEMVKEVNDTVVEKKDILSYSIYEYDSQKGLIKVG